MTLPNVAPIAVFHRVPTHVGEVALGGASAIDATHLADLLVYPDSVVAVFRRWGVHRPEDGLIVRQTDGPIVLRTGRFPPWQNSVAWVRDGTQLAMLILSGRQRRRLRAALDRAGFGVEEDRISLKSGRAHYGR